MPTLNEVLAFPGNPLTRRPPHRSSRAAGRLDTCFLYALLAGRGDRPDSVVAELSAAVSSVSVRRSSSDAELSLSPRRGSSPGRTTPAPPSSTATCPPVLPALRWPSVGSRPGSTHGGEMPPQPSCRSPRDRSARAVVESAAGEIETSEGVGRLGRNGPRRPGAGANGDPGGGDGGSNPGPRATHSLLRRNSTSTIYLSQHDNLSNPDLDTAILCVCAVFRVHMVEAVMEVGVEGSKGGGVYTLGKWGGDDRRGRQEGGCGGDRVAWQGLRKDCWQGVDVSVFDDPPSQEVSTGHPRGTLASPGATKVLWASLDVFLRDFHATFDALRGTFSELSFVCPRGDEERRGIEAFVHLYFRPWTIFFVVSGTGDQSPCVLALTFLVDHLPPE